METMKGAGRPWNKSSCGKIVTTVALGMCLVASRVSAQTVPDDATIEAFTGDVQNAFTGSGQAPGTPAMRHLIRLAFHDCVSVSGTCDGCIDFGDDDNAGLEATVTAIDAICETYSGDMSRADCYAAAGHIAVEETSAGGNNPITMPLLFGRTDGACDGTLPEGEFPDGEAGPDETFAFFADHFGFSAEDTVAIMGAHNLGEARPEQSGHDGVWTNDIDTLNNDFYANIIDPPWNTQTTAAGLVQWEVNGGGGGGGNDGGGRGGGGGGGRGRGGRRLSNANGGLMMLNSDASLFMDPFQGGGGPGQPTCGFNQCPDTNNRELVETYANDGAAFATDFRLAFILMTTRGYTLCDLAVVPDDNGDDLGCGTAATAPAR